MQRLLFGRRRTALSVSFAILGLALVIFRLTDLSEIVGVKANWAMTDFRTAIYYPVVTFLSGENPYDPSVGFPLYLPLTLLVHLPFGLLSEGAASSIYFVVTLILTFLLALVSLKFNKLEARTADILLIGGLLLVTRSGHWNLLVGQPALQIILATYVAFYFAESSPRVSGLGLAVSVMKPTFGVPIAVLMLAQRKIRPVVYGVCFSILFNLPIVALMIYREGGIVQFYSQLINNLTVWNDNPVVNPAVSIIRIDTIALISRFIGDSLGVIPQLVLFAAILGGAGLLLARTAKFQDEKLQTLVVGIVCIAVLLSIHHQAYDLLILTLPVVGLVNRRFPANFYTSRRYGLSVILLIILALNYASTHSIIRFLQPEKGLWLFLNSINGVVLWILFFIWSYAAYLYTKQLKSDTSKLSAKDLLVAHE